ncbi:hypothetical protein Q8F55_003516 [Vanrija albida]|uniref:Amino acid permease/ SLC12A domain-containing protein n=1 Tax=Vanrija albida TaxID=181172 RepID=A0ABR3Q4R1_9TREE
MPSPPGAAPPSGRAASAQQQRQQLQQQVSTSSTSSGGTMTQASTASSTASFMAAPTPYNTMCDTAVYDSTSRIGGTTTGYGADHDIGLSSASVSDAEILYGPVDDADVSIGPTLSPASSRRRPSSITDGLTSEASRRPSDTPSRVRLLPYSSKTSTGDYIPRSDRPVPAPPATVSTFSRDGTDLGLTSIMSTPSSAAYISDAPTSSTNRLTSRFRRSSAQPPKEVDRDTQRLQQLGYDAVLGRDYTFWSSLAISWLNIGCLQGTIFAVPGAYRYGGPTMMLVAWPISAVLGVCLVFTLSELASAYPVAGAMASWSWKLARGGVGGERYWGWAMGGIVLGGHIASLILLAWETVNVIEGTMGLAFEYHPTPWQGVLFFLALVLIVGTMGSTTFGRSPRYWLIAFGYGLSVWVVLCVSLLATGVSRRNYSPPISTKFYNSTGWNSRGLVYILGWQYTTIASGSDASAHMSEETQRPSRNVPNAMTASVILTYVLAYISIILLFISVNPDDAQYISGQSFPVGHILEKAISLDGAIGICVLMIIALCLQMQAQLQASSRFMFALARDRAVPFSDRIQRTNSSKQPTFANWAVVAMWAPFSCLLFVGNFQVLYSVVTTAAASLSMLGYFVPVFLYLISGMDLQNEGRSSWSMRKMSKPFAAIGAAFTFTVICVQVIPPKSPVKASNMSWQPVVITGMLLLCFITWKLYGAKHYSGPIRALTKWQTGVEIDLDSTLHASSNRAKDNSRSDGSFKILPTPLYESAIHTVTVGSARTVDTIPGQGEWAQQSFSTDESGWNGSNWGSGSSSGRRGSGNGGSGSDSTATFARTSRHGLGGGAMGRVAEDTEGEAAATAATAQAAVSPTRSVTVGAPPVDDDDVVESGVEASQSVSWGGR